jgi:uroporphyrinogen decarboxylase
MNSTERVLATIAGKPVDHRPVVVLLSLYGAGLIDCPLKEYYTNAGRYVEGQLAVRETFATDVFTVPFLLTAEGEAFGSQLTLRRNTPPIFEQPVLKADDAWDKLPIPDVDSSPRLVFIREALRRLVREARGEMPVVAFALSPADLPIMLLGLEPWLKTVLFDEAKARQLIDVTLSFFIRWTRALFQDGAAMVAIPQAFTNPLIVTADIAKRFSIPALKEALTQVNGHFVLHNVGQPILPFLELFRDAAIGNVVGYVLDPADSFTRAREILGPEPVLMGNFDAPSLNTRTAKAVSEACIALLHERRDDPRFILSTAGPDVPLNTPAENILAMIESVRNGSPR